MRIHIFNPEHDIALASGLSNFTAPHAGRQLRHDLGFLPAVWAEPGDAVMVDDVEYAERAWRELTHRLNTLRGNDCLPKTNGLFVPSKQTISSEETPSVEPWGWNSALRAVLLRRGLDENLMPTLPQLQTIRELSHRRTAAELLPKLHMEGTVGEAFECQTAEEVDALIGKYGEVVLKAPWSSSGRGLRFYSIHHSALGLKALPSQEPTIFNWLRNILATQGSIMVEPFYDKVKDFGMEFHSDGKGHVSYLGLSLFHTSNGAYTGNILATEAAKQEMISHYVSLDLINDIQAKICRELGTTFKDKYRGPFGVDMMVVKSPFTLHPCVEINLRRTMGHVALALAPHDDDIRLVMRIEYANTRPTSAASTSKNYKLTINRL